MIKNEFADFEYAPTQLSIFFYTGTLAEDHNEP